MHFSPNQGAQASVLSACPPVLAQPLEETASSGLFPVARFLEAGASCTVPVSPLQQPHGVETIIIPILQMRKLRPREVASSEVPLQGQVR